eukprot:4934765-Amphidinium_carterae.1
MSKMVYTNGFSLSFLRKLLLCPERYWYALESSLHVFHWHTASMRSAMEPARKPVKSGPLPLARACCVSTASNFKWDFDGTIVVYKYNI